MRPAPPGRASHAPSSASGGSGNAAVSRRQRTVGATLSSRWPVTSRSPVSIALRNRISTGSSPHASRELVDLALVREAGLLHTEPTHRSARRVVRAHRPSVDAGVRQPVRALHMRDRVDEHRAGRRCVGAPVEHHSALEVHEGAVGARVVPHPDRAGVPMHVAEERLVTAVDHLHRTAQTSARAGTRALAGSRPRAPRTRRPHRRAEGALVPRADRGTPRSDGDPRAATASR